MFGLETLEVAIGITFLFLFISLICTAIKELIEAILKTRAMDLERGIRELLNDPDGVSNRLKEFYSHPLIYPLYPGEYDPEKLKTTWVRKRRKMGWWARRELPSYIPAVNFAGAILDLVARGALSSAEPAKPAAEPAKPSAEPAKPSAEEIKAIREKPKDKLTEREIEILKAADIEEAKKQAERRGTAKPGESWSNSANRVDPTQPLSIADLRAAASKIENPRLQRAVLVALDTAKDDVDRAKANLATWYDGSMDRVSGWFKRRTQFNLFFIGLIAAIALNIDPITIAHRLRQDDTLRTAIVGEAEQYLQKARETTGGGTTGDDTSETDETKTKTTPIPARQAARRVAMPAARRAVMMLTAPRAAMPATRPEAARRAAPRKPSSFRRPGRPAARLEARPVARPAAALMPARRAAPRAAMPAARRVAARMAATQAARQVAARRAVMILTAPRPRTPRPTTRPAAGRRAARPRVVSRRSGDS